MRKGSPGTSPSTTRQQIFFFLGGLLLLVVIGFISWWITIYRTSQDYRLLLVQTDIALEDLQFDRAEQLLKRLVPLIRNPSDGMRIIRRGYELLDLTGSFGPLDTVSIRILEQYPGNQDVRGIRTAILLEQGNDTEAAEIAHGLTLDRWLPYKIEAYLKARIPLDDKLATLRLPGVALPIPVGSYSDPNSFLQAWTLTRDIRYLTNAVLLLNALGEIHNSYELMNSQRHRFESVNDLLLYTLLTFDSQGPQKGLEEISLLSDSFLENPFLYRLLGDIYYSQGQLEAASNSLEPLLLSEFAEPVDYLNRSRYFRAEEDYQQALSIIDLGLSRFSKSGILHSARVSLLQRLESADSAIFYLISAGNDNPDDVVIKLTHLLLDSQTRGYHSILANLWQLVLDYPESEQAGKILMWILWSLDDRAALTQFIESRDPVVEPWVNQFISLQALRANKPVLALQNLNNIPYSNSYAEYVSPGLQIALVLPQNEESIKIYNQIEKALLINHEFQPRIKDYFITMMTWRNIVNDNLDGAEYWYQRLISQNPSSPEISRLGYWMGQARNEYDNY